MGVSVAEALRCLQCRNVLGVLLPDGRVESRHGGRTWRVHLPAEVHCEDCGRLMVLDKSAALAVA